MDNIRTVVFYRDIGIAADDTFKIFFTKDETLQADLPLTWGFTTRYPNGVEDTRLGTAHFFRLEGTHFNHPSR